MLSPCLPGRSFWKIVLHVLRVGNHECLRPAAPKNAAPDSFPGNFRGPLPPPSPGREKSIPEQGPGPLFLSGMPFPGVPTRYTPAVRGSSNVQLPQSNHDELPWEKHQPCIRILDLNLALRHTAMGLCTSNEVPLRFSFSQKKDNINLSREV